MQRATRYYKNPKAVCLENVGGKNSVFLPSEDAHTAKVLVLNAVALEILKLLETPATLLEVVIALSDKYPASKDKIPADTERCLKHLSRSGIVKEVKRFQGNVLLVYPFCRNKDNYEPVPLMGLLTLANIINAAGAKAKVYDFQLKKSDTMDFMRHVRENKYEIIGFSANTVNVEESLTLAAAVKAVSPEVKIIFGGPHSTFEYERLLDAAPHIDMVFLGESENTIMAGLDLLFSDGAGVPPGGVAFRKNGNITVTPKSARAVDIDTLPFLDLSSVVNLADPREYTAYPVLTSRGCPFNCSYCASAALWEHKCRFRSIDNVVAEIRCAKERYGFEMFLIEDDTVTADRKRFLEFCSKIKQEHIQWSALSRVDCLDEKVVSEMRASGCAVVFLGVETLNEDTLSAIHKFRQNISEADLKRRIELCANSGMKVLLSFIIGLPGETRGSMSRTLDFCGYFRGKYKGKVTINMNFVSLFPGTELSVRAQEFGYSRIGDKLRNSLQQPVWESGTMSAADMWSVYCAGLLEPSEALCK